MKAIWRTQKGEEVTMFMLKHKACGTTMYVNPPVMRQKRTRCVGCGKMDSLAEGYLKSDSHGFFGEGERPR